MIRRLAIAAACGAVLGAAADGASASGPEIDNPYLPLAPGNRWVYRETAIDGSVQRVVVKVTHRTRLIANGVTARVVRDTVMAKGRLVEDTFDWYAQDGAGNVWYLGEDTREYKGGKVVSTAGSWEAGVNGARAGLAMPAHPRPGRQYRQEYLAGEAEDKARVVSRFEHGILTREWTPLEPKLFEYKLYERGVGPVLALTVPAGDREELVSFHRG
jgi:hypothetical protein